MPIHYWGPATSKGFTFTELPTPLPKSSISWGGDLIECMISQWSKGRWNGDRIVVTTERQNREKEARRCQGQCGARKNSGPSTSREWWMATRQPNGGEPRQCPAHPHVAWSRGLEELIQHVTAKQDAFFGKDFSKTS